MTDLESLVPELSDSATSHLPAIDSFLQRAGSENPWVCFEADVRAAAATALDRLRGHGGERCAELLRLCEFEEQTRCQAFQATIMGEVVPAVYQETVRSILEKLLGKLETCAPEPSLYQAAAQCLSEYMSALNYHCDICAVPRASQAQMSLPAIAESRDESCMDSSEYPSELGSEDAETLSVHSVHSETAEGAARRLSVEPSAFFGGLTLGGGSAGARNDRSMSDPEHERKERRRESNKKASVKYRAKKTVSTQQVLQESAVLRQQMSALTTQNTVLAAENQLLKQQVAFLQGMLQMQGTAPGAAPAAPGAATAGAAAPGAPGCAAPTAPALPSCGHLPSPSSVQAACGTSFGVCIGPGGAPQLPGGARAAPALMAIGGLSAPPKPPFAPHEMRAQLSHMHAPAAAAGAMPEEMTRQQLGGARKTARSSSGECGSDFGVSEWLTADAHLRL